MLFLDISGDVVYIAYDNKEYFLDRDDIEDTLWRLLIDLYKQKEFNQVRLLNGPGGFTNLRVGALCLNILNHMIGNKLEIFDITKLDLYQYLIGKDILPHKGLIYIGQRKNVWEYDFHTQTHTTVNKNDIQSYDGFLDIVRGEYWNDKSNMINLWFVDQKLKIIYQDKEILISLDELNIKPEVYVEAKYMVQPVISEPKKHYAAFGNWS